MQPRRLHAGFFSGFSKLEVWRIFFKLFDKYTYLLYTCYRIGKEGGVTDEREV